MKKNRFEIIIFVVDAICMILELVASRLLSPYFGNSNIVWTSVIGIILLIIISVKKSRALNST